MVRDPAKPPIPDRVSINPGPFFASKRYCQSLEVTHNGIVKNNVAEFCVSEGWANLIIGKTKDRHGKRLTIRVSGKIEVKYKDNNS